MRIKAVMLILLLLMSGCATVNQKVKTPVKEPPVTFNLKPLAAEPPTLQKLKQVSENANPNVILNLSFINVSLKKALYTIAKSVNMNILMPPDISGNVTMELKDVALTEGLNDILKPFGYSYTIDGNTIYIITKETKILRVNMPKTSRDFTSNMQANIGSSESGGSGSSTSSGTASMSLTNSASVDTWKNIETVIGQLIKDDPTASYSVEPESGIILIEGKPTTVDRVQNFIDKLNQSLERQVLINARIIEVTLSRNHQTGINWNYLSTSRFFENYNYSLSFGSGSPNQQPFQLKIFNSKFSNLIGLLSKYGKVNVLSSPRILAMNGQPAMIKVGKDYITIYESQTTSTTSTGGQTATTLTTENLETNVVFTEGIVLTIVPKIDANGNVILNITPAVSSLDTPINSEASSTESILNKIYAVKVRQLNTMVKVKNGQTIVLGGLIANTKNNSNQGIPGLKDIPFFGNLFKSNSETTEKSELVITLTPHIER